MPQANEPVESAARNRLARKYKVLGYDVQENPGPDRLPDFMRGAAPDIVARSSSDNVVIEIRSHASLKGSNDIVGIAERISGHADWRFELVVLEDNHTQVETSEADHRLLLEKVHAATSNRLFDMAFVYLVGILVQTARDLAARNNVPAGDRGDRSLVLDMGFRGILPDTVVERSLSALAQRNRLAHAGAQTNDSQEKDVQDLLGLCEEVKNLLDGSPP